MEIRSTKPYFIYKSLRSYFHPLRYWYNDYLYNRKSYVKYHSFVTRKTADEIWFSKFIKSRNISIPKKVEIHFSSVFDKNELLRNNRRNCVNVFFTGENLYTYPFYKVIDYLKCNPFDLELGFDYKTTDNYLRFPYWWITTHFNPEFNFQQIKEKVEHFNIRQNTSNTKFCALVSNHDRNGIRSSIANAISDLGEIEYGGVFRNNSSDLKLKFNDNKINYLTQFRFNICPENSNSYGYVTEKLFDAFESGCIPIYWGGQNHPEPDIINQNSIIFYNPSSGLDKDLITRIWTQRKDYEDFIRQPIFTKNAAEIIYEKYYVSLENRLTSLLSNL